MKASESIQVHVRRLLTWQDEAEAELVMVQAQLAGRVPDAELALLRLHLKVRELARIAADISTDSAEIERRLAYTISTSKPLQIESKPGAPWARGW